MSSSSPTPAPTDHAGPQPPNAVEIDRPTMGPRLQREWRHGLKGLVRFVREPSDLANSFDWIFSLAGPTVEREFEVFARHPVGQKLLAERPRRDLNTFLGDSQGLAAMPRGSLAHAYLDYLAGEEMGSADYFLEAAQLDDQARRFGWSEDQLWFVKRMANSHDLFHVISGYDRSIIGEIAVLAYTAGQIPLVPLKLLLAYLYALRPSQPVRWASFVSSAYRNGRDTPSLACVDYEELLPRPLQEARRALDVKELTRVHPHGLPTAGRLLERLESRVTLV